MRIRSIKPEFWRSDDIAELCRDDRLLFIGIWSYVDDNGVGRDQVPIIAADLFAQDLSIDPTETLMRVSTGLERLYNAGLIIRYKAQYKGQARNFLEVCKWAEHQRIQHPAKDRYPKSEAGEAVSQEGLMSSSGAATETLTPGAGEQGSRGAGTSSSDVASDESDTGGEPEEQFPDEVYELCDHLAEHIQRNGNKVGTVGKRWHQAMDRLLRIDDYTSDQVRQVIDWSQQNEFWQGNILSAPKLREKFDQLKTRMLNERNRASGPPQQFQTSAERRYAQGMSLVADELAEYQQRKEIGR